MNIGFVYSTVYKSLISLTFTLLSLKFVFDGVLCFSKFYSDAATKLCMSSNISLKVAPISWDIDAPT
jgi:hypothetical protein